MKFRDVLEVLTKLCRARLEKKERKVGLYVHPDGRTGWIDWKGKDVPFDNLVG